MRKGDIILLLMILLVAGGTWLATSWPFQDKPTMSENGQTGYDYVVSLEGAEVYRALLPDSEQKQYVTISLGATNENYPNAEAILEIAGGKIRVMPMPLELCPKQICCHVLGSVNQPGRTIVCMPNAMIIRIETNEDVGYDALAG